MTARIEHFSFTKLCMDYLGNGRYEFYLELDGGPVTVKDGRIYLYIGNTTLDCHSHMFCYDTSSVYHKVFKYTTHNSAIHGYNEFFRYLSDMYIYVKVYSKDRYLIYKNRLELEEWNKHLVNRCAYVRNEYR